MRIETKQCTEAGAMMRYPAFLIDEADKTCKRDRADAGRMTAFYEYMKDCVLEYCHSETFPTGGKYYVDYNVHQTPDGYDVEIFLRLRLRGRSIGNARLEHNWKNGVLDLEKNPRPKIRKRKKPAAPIHTK